MSAAERVVRLAAATLPPAVRERHREEWLADLAGAAEAGLRPSGIALGAVSFALAVDRADPAVSGLSVPALAARRARWSLALLGVGGVVGFGLYATGAALSGIGTAALVAAGIAALLGVLGLVVAAATLLPLPLPAALPLAALGALLAGALAIGLFSALRLVLMLLPILAVGVGALLCAVVPRDRPAGGPRATALAGVASAAAVVAILVVGTLHVTVWNPLAKLPGMTLDEIYAGLAAAGETPSPVGLVAWIVSGLLSAAAVVLVATLPVGALRRGRSLRRTIVLGLAAIAGTALSVLLAGFGTGMSIADAFLTDGGDAAATGAALNAVGVLAAIPAILLATVPGPRPADPLPT